MTPPECDSRKSRITDNLLHLARKILAEEAREFDELCVGHTQWALVSLVIEAPGICMSTAAEHLRIDKSAVTRAVRRLELMGYVERRRGARDRRAWELHPTRGSDRLAWLTSPGDTSPEGRLYFGFSEPELRQLDDFVFRLSGNLNITRNMAAFRSLTGRLPRDSLAD